MNPEEHKRKLVIDLTNDVEVVVQENKRVVICVDEEEEEELCDGCECPTDPGCGSFCLRCFNYTGNRTGDESSSSSSEEEDGNCCGMCGCEYESREDSADVCLGCYESERNICHGCKVEFPSCEFLDKAGEYCEGYCKECWPSVSDILSPVSDVLNK